MKPRQGVIVLGQLDPNTLSTMFTKPKEEDSDVEMQDLDSDTALPAPFQNETKDTPFGKAVLEGYKNDLLHLRGLRDPFYYNDNGFIMIKDPYHPNLESRIYISDHEVPYKEKENVNMRFMIVESTHEKLGHAGTDRIWATLRKSVFWPEMYRDVQNYCQRCDIC